MSAHFSLRELRCKDGTDVPPEFIANAEALMSQLELIRAADGRPIEVVSGYRTEAWNKGRGVSGSRHLRALAADIRPIIKVAGVRVPWSLVVGKARIIREFHEMILRMCQEDELKLIGGVGVYPGWVHCDIRPKPDGHLARWSGVGLGSEQIA